MVLNILILLDNGGPTSNKVQMASCVISGATIIFGLFYFMQFVLHKSQRSLATQENSDLTKYVRWLTVLEKQKYVTIRPGRM